GQVVSQEARDGDGLICINRRLNGQTITLLFHAKESSVQIPELAGKWDILNERVFDGAVNGITAMVLV
ncbi:MAG: hypothetical protein U0L15_06925, partial [Oscillospiraceae bacterium]|nr:hypothetical protein [Oscillospiraceae bacterium]